MPYKRTLDEFIQELLDQYEQTVSEFYSDPEKWKHFLRVSCNNYKLRFDQQTLLFAQNPNATIVATHDQWFKLFRPVIARAKGLYVLNDEQGRDKRYVRFYEQDQTRVLPKSQPIPFWTMQKGYKGIVTDALKAEVNNYSEHRELFGSDSFTRDIILAAETLAENAIDTYYDELLEEADLNEHSEDEIIDKFNALVTNSVAYALFSRLGYYADEIIDTSVFKDVKIFNSKKAFGVVGKATQKITQDGLAVIAKAIRRFEREREVQNEKDKSRVHGNVERRKARIQHGIVGEQRKSGGIRPERRSSDEIPRQDERSVVSVQRGTGRVRPDVRPADGRGASDDEIRQSEESIPRGKEILDVRRSSDDRKAEQALQRAERGMRSDGRTVDGTDERVGGTDERASEERLVGIRSRDPKSPSESAGDRYERADLRIDQTENTENKAEYDTDTSDSAFSVSKPLTIIKFGDFYELHGEDARIAAELLQLHLAHRKGMGDMVGFPIFALDKYAAMLDGTGYVFRELEDQKKKAEVKDELLFVFGKGDAPAVSFENGIYDTHFTESGELSKFAIDMTVQKQNISFALANAVFEYLDEKINYERQFPENNAGWYDKTDFFIKSVINGEEFDYQGRYDIGDGKGSGGGTLIEHIRGSIEARLKRDHPIENKEQLQNYLDVFIPFLEAHSELTKQEQRILEQVKKDYPIKIVPTEDKSVDSQTDENWENRRFMVLSDYDGDIDEKGQYASVSEAVEDSRKHLMVYGYDGFCVYDLDSKLIQHIEGNFHVENAFNESILIKNGYGVTKQHIEKPSEQLSLFSDDNEAKRETKESIADTKQAPQKLTRQDNTPLDFDLRSHPVEIETPKARYKRNAAAIRTLKAIEKDDRRANAEEQLTLSKYVGWGGLQEAFDSEKTNWASEYRELRELLNDDEYRAARASTRTAFFTPPEVTEAVWKALRSFGFENGNVLEPACGVGNFIGAMPNNMQRNSKVYAVELDSISSRIAAQLYRSANVMNVGYEKSGLPDNFFDIAIGNVPFDNFKINEKRFNGQHFFIHDFFFAEALEHVRPGGIVAFVTSSGTLDKENSSVRQYLAQRAELIGAIRLPDSIFKGNAGTEVTSDIIFLQKRDHIIDDSPDWVYRDMNDKGIPMNGYFVQHPEMIMGEMVKISGRFGETYTCRQKDGTDITAMLDRAIGMLSATITERSEDITDDELSDIPTELLPADPNVRDGCYAEIDGKIYVREYSHMVRPQFKGNVKEKENIIRDIIPIRDTLRRLIEIQKDDYPDDEIRLEQKHLDLLYESFVKRHGRLNERKNQAAFKEDNSAGLVFSLENIDEHGQFISKADIFTKRTISARKIITHVDTAQEALAVSLGERACVDMDYMMQLSDKTEDELYRELEGAVFVDPFFSQSEDGTLIGKYIAHDDFLSGNVREKLQKITSLKEINQTSEYDLHISELQKVVPKDLTPAEIDVPLGASWIPVNYINDFMNEIFDIPYYYQSSIRVSYSSLTNTWKIDGKSKFKNFKISTTYGTSRKNGFEILEDCLLLKNTEIKDKCEENGKEFYKLNPQETMLARDKQEALKQAFEDWIWKHPERRKRLTKLYNNKFNSIVPRVYDGSHLTFAGMNPEFKLKKHQLNAVARIIYGGNTLLAHTVGAGKTFEMAAAAMELKRLGLANKSMIVVPNHLLLQWRNEFLMLYPGANILVAGAKDFSTLGRKRFTSRIAMGEYDAIIISQSQFEKVQLSPEYQQKVIEEEIERISEIKNTSTNRLTVKQSEGMLKRLREQYQKLANAKAKDDTVYFEELGIDHIFVDESQDFKNLAHPTKLQGLPGLVSGSSQKATNMHMICRYLDEQTNGKGVVFATGTPLANSISEVYTIMYNLQYSLLEQMNMTSFDAWISCFARSEVVQDLAYDNKSYKEKLRITGFTNVPELKRLVFECMDIQTADMLALPVPKAITENIVLKPSKEQQEIMESFVTRAENFAHKRGNYSPAEMLLITSDAKKLSLDQRCYDPNLPESPTCKAIACADKIVEVYRKYNDTLATQLVFCDSSTPNGKNAKDFSMYNELKNKLIDRGIPKEEIAFIHDAKNDDQRNALFKKVREGTVRVLIGSTEKMGTGTNVQERVIAVHHLDCPWRPMDVEQKNGRAIRQGNKNKEVFIFNYVTEGTFDSNLYSLLARKQTAIAQFYSPNMTQRKCEDIDDTVLTYLDIAAATSGNPLIKEQAELQKEVTKLMRQRTTYMNEQYALRDKIDSEYPEKIARLEKNIPLLEADLETAKAHSKGTDFAGMVVNGELYDKRKDAGAALIEAAQTNISRIKGEIGSYRGFKTMSMYSAMDRAFVICARGKKDYDFTLGTDPVGNITRFDNVIAGIKDRVIHSKEVLREYKNEYEKAKSDVEKPFPHEQELKEKKARIDEINKILTDGKDDRQIKDINE